MPVLQLDDQQFPLKTGANRIGAGTDADVVVPGYSMAAVDAIVDGGSPPTIRRATGASQVRVNGVLLGAEPTPLVHGDRLEVAGLELRYADDTKNGATQFISASEIAALTGARRSGTARATMASGGRIVSLVDGKEYGIPADGLVFGRDAACDVVVPQSEVSRRHAEIVPEASGYLVKDISANGLFVNGERVQGQHLLARADIVRIGSEEFRFYADVAPSVAPRASDSLVIPPSIDEPIVAPPPAPPASRAESRPALAELEMLNEVRYVVDMESSNGTYLGDIRIAGQPTAKMPSPPDASTPVAESEKTGGTPTTVWVVIGLAVVAAVAFFLLQG